MLPIPARLPKLLLAIITYYSEISCNSLVIPTSFRLPKWVCVKCIKVSKIIIYPFYGLSLSSVDFFHFNTWESWSFEGSRNLHFALLVLLSTAVTSAFCRPRKATLRRTAYSDAMMLELVFRQWLSKILSFPPFTLLFRFVALTPLLIYCAKSTFLSREQKYPRSIFIGIFCFSAASKHPSIQSLKKCSATDPEGLLDLQKLRICTCRPRTKIPSHIFRPMFILKAK